MSSDTARPVRVFVNAVGVSVRAGASILDAVRAFDAAEADAVARGEKLVTDSRGLPIAADRTVSAGSIFRLLPVRKRGGTAETDDESRSEDA
jgi:hypothetical protein